MDIVYTRKHWSAIEDEKEKKGEERPRRQEEGRVQIRVAHVDDSHSLRKPQVLRQGCSTPKIFRQNGFRHKAWVARRSDSMHCGPGCAFAKGHSGMGDPGRRSRDPRPAWKPRIGGRLPKPQPPSLQNRSKTRGVPASSRGSGRVVMRPGVKVSHFQSHSSWSIQHPALRCLHMRCVLHARIFKSRMACPGSCGQSEVTEFARISINAFTASTEVLANSLPSTM